MKSSNHVQKTALTVTRWIGSPSSLVVHTILFVVSFLAVDFDYISWNEMLLFVTTIVSLEAIYLSIFIQMTINYTTQELEDVGEDIDEIQKDIDELQEDVEDISEEEVEDEKRKSEQRKTLTDIRTDLRKLMNDIERLQKNEQSSNKHL